MTGKDVCVVGASNIDLISYIARLPSEGETLHGTEFRFGFGGKGANQAVMASRLGASVSMITKLGDDFFGEQTLDNFKKNGIDTTHIYFTDQAFSGGAPIVVDSKGNNSIIIVTGANDLLNKEEICSASKVIKSSKVLLCQMEIPIQISKIAMEIARDSNIITILNPAPANSVIPSEIFGLVDVLCPNTKEAEVLSGLRIRSVKDAEKAGNKLLEKVAKVIIITLGKLGSLLVTKNKKEYYKIERFGVIDSTGAGDAFIGSLAVCLAKGIPLSDAVLFSNKIAGITVQKKGTQTSFPYLQDIPAVFQKIIS